MIKIYGVEDHLFEQIEKFNGNNCFIEDFIEQAYQFGMLDEKLTSQMRDRKKSFVYHSTNAWISINGDVKKNIEVKHNTRRKRNATTNIFVTQK